MKDLRVELFNFKRTLDINETEVNSIIETHMNGTTYYSELELIGSLNEKLNFYTFKKDVSTLLESLNRDIVENKLTYDLKNLYQVLNRQEGYNAAYLETPIKTIMEILNTTEDDIRMSKIFNELAVYDYVPEIRNFVLGLTTSPKQRNNLLSSGKAENVCSIAERVDGNSFVTFIKDSWFLLTQSSVEKTVLENHIKDLDKLRSLKAIETGLRHSTFQNGLMRFVLNKDMVVSIDGNNGIYLNEEKMNDGTTIEDLFETSVISQMYVNYYPIIKECQARFDDIVEFDIITKVTNLTKPYLECYVFNINEGGNYIYNCDTTYNGFAFYEYKNVIEVLHEVQSELNYDLTYFFENKIEGDMVKRRKLEDTEKAIISQLEKVETYMEKLNISIQTMGEDKVLLEAMKNMQDRKEFLNKQYLKTLEEKENYKVIK
jgi:hypothetical protein